MSNIEFFDNIFEIDFCRKLLSDAESALSTGREFARSNFHWGKRIVNGSFPVFVRDYDFETSENIISRLRARSIIDRENYFVLGYAWTRLSFIPWHRDENHQSAITIYLNETWDLDWGGLFLYKDKLDGEICGIPPTFNCGVKNNSNIPHSTTPVSIDAPTPRFTLQLFHRTLKSG